MRKGSYAVLFLGSEKKHAETIDLSVLLVIKGSISRACAPPVSSIPGTGGFFAYESEQLTGKLFLFFGRELSVKALRLRFVREIARRVLISAGDAVEEAGL
jgi:hypothetical protein